MNTMGEEEDGRAEPISPADDFDRRWIASSPPALRRYIEVVQATRRVAVEAITQRHKMRAMIEAFQKSAGMPEAGQRNDWRRTETRKLERAAKQAEKNSDKAKAACRRAEKALLAATLKYQIEMAPSGLRKQARKLLVERRRALEKASELVPMTAGEYGSVAGRFFGIEIDVQEARSRGDKSEVERLTPLLEAARLEKERADAAMEEDKTRYQRIAQDYADRFQALLDEQHRP